MQVTETMACIPAQLANAEKLFNVLSKLPAEKQDMVTMVANAFIEGMKAQERSMPTTERQCATCSTYANRSIKPA